MNRFIGIDLGGTNLRAGIVEADNGQVFATQSVPTLAHEGHDAVIGRMAGLVHSLMEANGLRKSDISGIGIGVPGVLNLEQGKIVFLPNLPDRWLDVPLSATIASQAELPVYLLNDVRSITYGEWKFGAGRGVDTMACFAIGTGIGGGLVINGKLHIGIGGTAGELGHQTIDFNGPVCGCGNRGCLEAFASGPAIAAMGLKAVTQGLTTSIGALVNYDLNKITPDIIGQAARQGDQVAKDIYDLAGMYLGVAIANVLVSVGPRKVVIGGGVSAAGDLLLDPIRRTVKERVTVMPVEQVEIVPAALGANAGIIGVAMWAAQRLSERR
jgi:glucokinase